METKKHKIATSIKHSIKKIKYLDRTQKTYFIVSCFLAAFVLFTGVTYAYFTVSKHLGAATITIAKLNYSLESKTSGYSNGSIVVGAGETVFLDLDLRSYNAERTRYALNYETASSGVKVYYSESLKENMSGIIGASGSIINMRGVIVNSGSSDATVTFTVSGGYLQNTVTTNITEGYFETDQTIRYVTYDENFENETVRSSIPDKSNYAFYKSECSNGGIGTFDETNWTFTITSAGQTSCDVYFKKVSSDLEIYYDVLGSNGLHLISTTKPDTGGLYTYETSSCSNNATYTFDSTTFQFDVTSYTANTLCVANFTTNQELQLAERYIITFDSNGGTRSYSKEVRAGGTYGDLPEATKSGYTLLGWYTAPEGGEEITSTTPVTITSNQTLYAHWEEKINIVDAIIASANTGTPDFSQIATTDEGVFAMEDDYGTSYYYRGAVENNYVYFAGYYWRIIRINGDGSVRMIYDGTQAYANGTSSTDRLALTSTAWNSTNYNDAKYVGYMYGGANGTASTSKEQAQTNETDSNIKTQVDAWYKTNIVDAGYADAVSDEIFCNDREIVTDLANSNGGYYSSYTTLGYGTNKTLYMAASRVGYKVTNPTPSFTCTQQNDAFTVNDTTKGNGALTYPVGLITADEIVAAGSGKYNTANSSYYLYKGSWYWSLSPSFMYSNGYAYVFYVSSTGSLTDGYSVYYASGAVAPVINLSAEYAATLTGAGTAASPYTA